MVVEVFFSVVVDDSVDEVAASFCVCGTFVATYPGAVYSASWISAVVDVSIVAEGVGVVDVDRGRSGVPVGMIALGTVEVGGFAFAVDVSRSVKTRTPMPTIKATAAAAAQTPNFDFFSGSSMSASGPAASVDLPGVTLAVDAAFATPTLLPASAGVATGGAVGVILAITAVVSGSRSVRFGPVGRVAGSTWVDPRRSTDPAAAASAAPRTMVW